MSIVIEKANSRFSKSQFDIMENYKVFITKGFVSLIGAKTRLQPKVISCRDVVRVISSFSWGQR